MTTKIQNNKFTNNKFNLNMDTLPDNGRIMQFNSTGLPKYRCELIKRQILSNIKPLVLLINETKLSNEGKRKIDDLLNLDNHGYNHKVKNRNTSAGGVAFIYRDNLTVHEIKIPELFSELEAIVCTVEGPNIHKYTLATYYNNPSTTLNLNFLRWLSSFENCILMGDLNSKHPSLNCYKENKSGKILSEALFSDAFYITSVLFKVFDNLVLRFTVQRKACIRK